MGLTPEHGVKIIITVLTRHIKSQIYTVQIQACSYNNPLSLPTAQINNLADELLMLDKCVHPGGGQYSARIWYFDTHLQFALGVAKA
jgi:hypothetical protein